MNVIISFCGLEDRQNALHTRRSFPLQPLAAGTILGHILERLKDLVVNTFFIIVNDDVDAVQYWVQDVLSEQSFKVLQGQGKTPLAGLTHDLLLNDSEPLLFVSGEFVTEADYGRLGQQEADVVCLVQEGVELIPAETLPVDQKGVFTGEWGENQVMWAGCCWFRTASDLKAVVAEPGFKANPYLNTLLTSLKKHGLTTATLPSQSCFGTGSAERLLHANARLMQLGYCSEDAIERSYSEEFTVLPPVFLHETAVIENSVVGPFVNLEAGAVVRNCVVRNTFIGEGAEIEDAVIENSFIGQRGHVLGLKHTVIVGDDTRLIAE